MNKREMVCYETDSSRIIGMAEKVISPETIKEVQEIVKNAKNDIVPRGSGTGLVGGCIPDNSIVVDMSKMDKVTNFLSLRKTVRIGPGITLKELNEKLNSVGYEFPIDVPKNGISTIGGIIARNASGDRSMRYGNVKDWIEEIEFVNGKGELMKTSKADLTDVCSMEGITGIIVGATIKLAPLIKKSASVFQTDDLNEVLSIARKLRNEKEVVILELFSPYVSKLLGLPEKYNLIIEFNSDRGKIKDKDYEELTKIRESVFSKLYSEGYYNVEDPKFFFDKLKDAIMFLEENQTPYIGHLGVGIIHPFFKDSDSEKREKVTDYIKKMKAVPGKFGIGLTRKYFIDNFQVKIIQRIKTRHDPLLKFNKGKLIDMQGYSLPRRAKGGKEGKEMEKIIEENEPKSITGEELSALKISREINVCEEKEDTGTEKPELNNKETKESEKEKNSNELSFQEVQDRLKDYKETFESELIEEKMHNVEEIARNIPRDIIKKEIELEPIIKKEKVKVDYNQIRNIMTNKGNVISNESKKDASLKPDESINKGRVTVSDNLDRKDNLTKEDKDLINKILGDKYKKNNKDNGSELI